jgi:hypothetical protein
MSSETNQNLPENYSRDVEEKISDNKVFENTNINPNNLKASMDSLN